MDKKRIEQIKLAMLIILYALCFPLISIVFKLIPYILANNTDIDLGGFALDILKHPFVNFVDLSTSNYSVSFIVVHLLVLLLLFIFLHPSKREPFTVVGKTTPVHGSSYWGESHELNVPQQVHFINEKDMKKILELSMKEGAND